MVNSPKGWKDVVIFGSCGSVTDCSDTLQMFGESTINCSALYGIDIPACIFFGIARVCGEVRVYGEGVVIHGGIRMCYLLFAYTPVFTLSSIFS